MAAAGLWTTPSDLARYAMAVQQAYAGEAGSLLGADLTREMLTPGMNGHGLGPGVEDGYGVFVMTDSDRAGRLHLASRRGSDELASESERRALWE